MVRLFGLSLIAVFFSLNVFAGGSVAGKVTIVKGQVFIVRGFNKILAKKDDTVIESDSIEAEARSTARITMIDSNVIDIYPKSKMVIAKYLYKPIQDKKNVELKVDFGKIRSTVNQKYDGAKNTFQVKTPTAVAGVRGTIFTIAYDPVRRVSEVVTIHGLVSVAKLIDNKRLSAPVFVRPNQIISVNADKQMNEQPREFQRPPAESAPAIKEPLRTILPETQLEPAKEPELIKEPEPVKQLEPTRLDPINSPLPTTITEPPKIIEPIIEPTKELISEPRLPTGPAPEPIKQIEPMLPPPSTNLIQPNLDGTKR